VRFLVDANVSPRDAALLVAAGHDAIALRDVGLAAAPDDDILDWASPHTTDGVGAPWRQSVDQIGSTSPHR
jgi:predicted nuclease of predicted toxin-antitoxin system